MDEDTIELVRRLSTKAGMIMEDASAIAVSTPRDPETLKYAIDSLEDLVLTAIACVHVARLLLGQEK